MPFKVLVVEDEPLIGMDLATLAERMGFEVAGPAISSQSAMMAASDFPPDLAIVDVNLTGGLTGPLVASQLAHLFGTCVLMVTANPEMVVAGAGGITAVLEKPFLPSEVAAALALLAAQREAADTPRIQ